MLKGNSASSFWDRLASESGRTEGNLMLQRKQPRKAITLFSLFKICFLTFNVATL